MNDQTHLYKINYTHTPHSTLTALFFSTKTEDIDKHFQHVGTHTHTHTASYTIQITCFI